MQESVAFHNLTSLLKFRLSGAVASRVKTVTFQGSGVIAGDMIFRMNDGMLEEIPGSHFKDSFSRISLQGDFEAGVDYYIALWPRQMTGFRMVFSDGEGNSTTRQSVKSVTFARSRVKDFGTIDLGDEFLELNDGSLDPVRYMTASEGTKPVTVAVVPDGFTKDQLPLYEQLAKSGIDALFSTEPYKTYRKRFNVYILKVASAGSGANVTDGYGHIINPSGCYFGSKWGADSYGDMSADADVVFDFVGRQCPDIVNGIHTVQEVPVILLINDSRYGGICWSWSDGQGYAMVPYTGEGEGLCWGYSDIVPATDDPLPTPVTEEMLDQYSRYTTQDDLDEIGGYNVGDWRNTLTHEFGGHCFGRLDDEYWGSPSYTDSPVGGHSWPVPFSLNVSDNPYSTPWQQLLDNREGLMALDAHYERIGAFQAAGEMFGRWRSEKISCMIDNRFYFSAWQRYLITQRIFELSGDGDSFSYEGWLAGDVTTDPVRDVVSNGAPGASVRRRTVTRVPPLPHPVLVEK